MGRISILRGARVAGSALSPYRILLSVHPVLFHLGSVLIPSYGVMTAIGVLLALGLAQRTARIVGVDPAQMWNLCVVSLFAALVGERVLLIVVNWSVLRLHPAWTLGLAMVHHPLVASAGAAVGLATASCFARWRRMPWWSTADALAAPVALGLACEQVGALLAGSGYGTDASAKLPWAVTYTSVMAVRWSGTPIGVPLHPVQAYAALAFFTLAVFLWIWLPARRQPGDVAGMFLIGLGAAIYFTEIWRDPEGRGLVLAGALDGPQIAAVGLVILGGFLLREKKRSAEAFPFPAADGEAQKHSDGERGQI